MSGDVQPRKRKDKKKKKDELGVEEPRGTAAVLGEGDVFIHSQHEHGTGGHWCAKIIFFSLLAVLITLIGLIILENRGLTELEANSVESRYSGVLEGWLEDAHDDDHHDEHTLELKHHGNVPHDDLSQEIDDDDELDDDQLVDDHKNEYNNDLDDQDEDDEIQRDSEENDDNDDKENDDNEEERASQEDDDDDDQDQTFQDDDYEDDDQDHASQEDDDEQAHGSLEDDDDDDIEPNIQKDDLNRQNEDDLFESNYYDDDQDDISQEIEQPEVEPQDQNDSQENLEDSNEQDEDLENGEVYRHYKESEERSYDAENDDGDDSFEDLQKDNIYSVNKVDNTDDQSVENDERNYDDNYENKLDDSDEDEEHEEEEQEDSGIEVEKLEKEVTDDLEQASVEEDVADHDDKSEDVSAQEDDTDLPDDDEFLEADDVDDLPVVEHIVAPKGKPFVEVEEEPTTVKPADTLADEEEYEKQQEKLRQEQEQASHMWLKLVVGGALLVATHAVVRRATATRDDASSEEHETREDTPSAIDRRMTLIPPEPTASAPPREVLEQKVNPVVREKIFEKVSSTVKSAPIKNKNDDDSEDEQKKGKEVKQAEVIKDTKQDKELYSDDEEAEDEEMVEEEKVEEISQDGTKTLDIEAEESELPDDVEIIDEEQLGEELEEEEEEEEEDISDVDDAELLNRLEAKYGRLPEPERPERKHKDGGNSIDDWPGEPSDQYWRQQLDQAEEELRRGDWSAASQRLSSDKLRASGRAKWLTARAIDVSAEQQRDNRLLSRAINAYLEVLKMNERLSDARLLQVTERILDRIRFRGNYLSAEPVYRLLIRRFPDVVDYPNNLTVSFLMANRADLAEDVIKETLKKWPDDRFALAHLGFVLKTKHNKLEEAVEAFEKALEGDIGPATEPRFYYHLGDSLLLLGRFAEAHEVHKRGAALGHFLSPAQRSLYNVDRLKSQPWWDVNKTPYAKLARALEKSWKEILKEGEAARALYEMEKEGLKERGEWSQLDLFVRGREVPETCARAPVTCGIVRAEAAAAGCRRGQVKFSAMKAGTHVRPHVGPTNCRLRMHLGLSNTKDTYIRVDQEIRQWQVGKVLMFDDSFEHEVWHNGTGTRLVLIVDVWHPALTPHERRTLPPI